MIWEINLMTCVILKKKKKKQAPKSNKIITKITILKKRKIPPKYL